MRPAFTAARTLYTASVVNTVSSITVLPTATDAYDATVAYLDENNAALADADGMAHGQQVDLSVGENTIQLKVTAKDTVTTETYVVVVTRRTPPAVRSIELDSYAGEDNTYGPDDWVFAKVRFSEAVTVDRAGGTPKLELDFDGKAKQATYASGTGTAALFFRYKVKANDMDADGIAIGANKLTLGGATILATADNTTAAVLDHAAVPADPSHKAIGTALEFVSDDPEIAAELATEVYLLADGTLTLTPKSGPGGSSPMRPERWSCPSWPVPASGSRCSSGAVVGYRRSRCTRIAQPWPRAG